MQNRNRLIVVIVFVVLLIVALGGIYFINQSSNLAIENTSASVTDQVKLTQLSDNLNQDRVIIDMSLNVSNDNVKTGKIILTFDKNVLNGEEVISNTNVIATNQKVDNSNGTVTYEFQSIADAAIKGEFDLGKVIFTKLEKGSTTSIKLSSNSTIGFVNSLDPSPVEVTVDL